MSSLNVIMRKETWKSKFTCGLLIGRRNKLRIHGHPNVGPLVKGRTKVRVSMARVSSDLADRIVILRSFLRSWPQKNKTDTNRDECATWTELIEHKNNDHWPMQWYEAETQWSISSVTHKNGTITKGNRTEMWTEEEKIIVVQRVFFGPLPNNTFY